ncbi:MAG: hypothetical protein GX173_04780 [Ruminococcaceae bacterium]|nr:hypothetical protein [Oscillospiraceae bacterium]
MDSVVVCRIKADGEIGRKIELTVQNNLLQLDVDADFLEPLRQKTGAYLGTGMLLSACAWFYAQTGLDLLFQIRNHLLAELLHEQDQDGYIGCKPAEERIWKMFDIDEISQLIMGLVDDYQVFHEERSLVGAKKLSVFVMDAYQAYPGRIPEDGKYDDTLASILLDYALFHLYETIEDPAILDFLILRRKLPEWNLPIVKGRWGIISGHAYGYLGQCLAQLKSYRLHPDSRLLRPAQRVMRFLCQEDGMLITGSISEHECWHDSQYGGWYLGETCAASYLLNVLNELMAIENKPIYGDMMERVIYNALFAAQSPDGRQLRYYTPFEGKRAYFDRDTYCCPNNYRKTIAQLPSFIYHVRDNLIHVNLYSTSELNVVMANQTQVSIKQVTDYPGSGDIRFAIESSEPVDFIMSFRMPLWCEKCSLQINGQPLDQTMDPGHHIALRRTWQNGDRIDLSMAMAVRFVKGRKSQSGRIALMRGPLVFCLSRTRNEQLAKHDLRELVVDPATLAGPFTDQTLRPGGLLCSIHAWHPACSSEGITLYLSEFTDPEGEAIYFKPLNPADKRFRDDELWTQLYHPAQQEAFFNTAD